jgi:DNA polymerase delta subunit 4
MTSAKNSSSRNGSAPLKQGTLSFSSAKRTNSNTTAKTKKPPPPTARRSSSTLEKEKERADDAIHLERNDEGDDDDVLEMSPDEDDLDGDLAIESTRGRTAAGKSALPDTTKAPAKRVKADPPAVKPVEQRPSLDVTAKKYRKHYGQVREKMGNLEPSEYHNICAFCPTCGAKSLTHV